MKIYLILLSAFVFQFSNAQMGISADQLWADQQCGGNAAYKKDEKKFNDCVDKKLASKNSKSKTQNKSGLSDAEFEGYMKGCRDAFKTMKPNMDVKDVEMMCADPYLSGHPNESKEDKARRERLIKETNADKEKHMKAVLGDSAKEKESVPYDMSQSMEPGEYKKYLDSCKEALKSAGKIKDPLDINMMCKNPYLYEDPKETHEEKARRIRLIKQSDSAKEDFMKSAVKPPADSPDKKTQKTNVGQ